MSSSGATAPTLPAQRAEAALQDWAARIKDLDAALDAESAAIRAREEAETDIAVRRAECLLSGLPGKNETERSAALTVALATDGVYQEFVYRLTTAERDLRAARRG